MYAEDIIPLQSTAAYNHFGASGWTKLNEDGDRYATNYQIWGYRIEDGGMDCEPYIAGTYEFVTDTVTWYTDEIGYVPPHMYLVNVRETSFHIPSEFKMSLNSDIGIGLVLFKGLDLDFLYGFPYMVASITTPNNIVVSSLPRNNKWDLR